MNLGVFSLYWDNIDDKFRYLQKRVMDHFGVPVMQHRVHGFQHADWIDWILTYKGYRGVDVILFLDIDCIPLEKTALSRAFHSAVQGKIHGCAQSAAHLTRPTEIYVGPFFMCLSRRTHEYIGAPSAQPDKDFDVAQRLTVSAKGYGIEPDYLWPTEIQLPKWKLGEDKVFGIGTTYDNSVFHLFESRTNRYIEQLEQRVATLLGATVPQAL